MMKTHSLGEKSGHEDGRKGLWRPILLLVFIIAMLVLSSVFGLGERLNSLRGWIDSLGAWGPVVFSLLYIVAVVAALPGSALTVVAGALFGSLVGIILVSISATIGASLAFLISRYFARESVARWLENKETFRRLDQLTEKHGAVIVALTRLAPIFPFNLLNYGFGLTRVSFWTYLFWTWLCILPGTILYVVGTDVIVKAISEGRVPWGLIVVLAAVVVAIAFLVRFANRRLRAKEDHKEDT